jgi:hypothetical protein
VATGKVHVSATAQARRAAGKGSVAAVAIKQRLTDYPTETHVYTSLWCELPLHVTTENHVWHIDGNNIEYRGRLQELGGSIAIHHFRDIMAAWRTRKPKSKNSSRTLHHHGILTDGNYSPKDLQIRR